MWTEGINQMNRVGYKQDSKIKYRFCTVHIIRFEAHPLKAANLSAILCVGAKFPTFAMEAAAKAAGRQAGPSQQPALTELGQEHCLPCIMCVCTHCFLVATIGGWHLELEPVTLQNSQGKYNHTRICTNGITLKLAKNQVVPWESQLY